MAVKRFIAGAVCQHCSQQDKIRAWEDLDARLMHRECVACGNEEVLTTGNSDAELPTRVNYADPVFDEDVKPIRLTLDDSGS